MQHHPDEHWATSVPDRRKPVMQESLISHITNEQKLSYTTAAIAAMAFPFEFVFKVNLRQINPPLKELYVLHMHETA